MPRPFHRVIDSRRYIMDWKAFFRQKNKQPTLGPMWHTSKVSRLQQRASSPFVSITIPILGQALQHGRSIHFAGTAVGFRGRRRRRLGSPLAAGNSPPQHARGKLRGKVCHGEKRRNKIGETESQ